MKKINAIILLLFSSILPVQAATINICTDKNFWYPFTYVQNKQSAGLHIAIVRSALKSTQHSYSFTPLPWERCLKAAKKGRYDAVVSASYKDKRAEYLHYPKDAKTAKKSDNRISQVEYVVVSMATHDYNFDGEIKGLPSPVRATKGYSIVDDLIGSGLKVDTAKGDANNLRKLLRDKKGVVITLPETARYFSQQAKFKNKLKIHPIPIKSKSYYMPFSKHSSLSEQERVAIWQAIAHIRDDEALVQKFINDLSNTKQ